MSGIINGVVRLYDSNGVGLATDGITNSLKTIDYVHHEIHNSNAYYISRTRVRNDGESSEIRFATPNTTKWSHFEFSVSGTGKTDVFLYEGTTKTHVVGNVLNAINRNRNSANTSGLIVCHTPAGSGDGTNIGTIIFGTDSGTGANRRVFGGESSARQELILKQNTAYLLRVTSGTAGNRFTVIFNWYEHTSL